MLLFPTKKNGNFLKVEIIMNIGWIIVWIFMNIDSVVDTVASLQTTSAIQQYLSIFHLSELPFIVSIISIIYFKHSFWYKINEQWCIHNQCYKESRGRTTLNKEEGLLQNCLPVKFQDVKFKDPKFKHEISWEKTWTFILLIICLQSIVRIDMNIHTSS